MRGYYYRETRFLRTLQLRINGYTPWPCEAAAVAPDTLAFTYVHPEITTPGGGGTGDEENTDRDGIPERAVDVRVTYRVRAGWLDVRTVVANHARRPLHLKLSRTIDADFTDIQEAESSRPRNHHLEFRTRIDPEDALTQEFDLSPQQVRELAFRVLPLGTSADLSAPDVEARQAAVDEWRRLFSRIEIPGNRLAERIVADNVRDVASFPLLDGNPDEWLALQAGMPLYPVSSAATR